MPTYRYRCDECRHEFEELQAITATPLSDCPKCAGKVHRIISGGAGFLFKGSGFYKTDYRDKKYLDASKKDSDSSISSSKSSETKNKPAEKKSETTSNSKNTDSKKSPTS